MLATPQQGGDSVRVLSVVGDPLVSVLAFCHVCPRKEHTVHN